MATEDLLSEFQGLFKLNAVMVARLGEVYAELKRRGVAVTIPGTLMKTLIPKVALGLIAAEAVAEFLGAPELMNAVARLPPAEQRRLAAGGTIPVVVETGAEPVEMTAAEVYEARLRHVFRAGKVLNPEQQAGLLKSFAVRNRKVSTGRLKAMAKRGKSVEATGDASRDRATETDIEQLAARIEREARMRGSGTVTPRQAAEMAAMFGWGPVGRWSAS